MKRKRAANKNLSRLYTTWLAMKSRCNNPKNASYKWYGEKGISVCEEWNKSFKNFQAWALQNGYTDNLQIDRLDHTQNYHPLNCRWVTPSEQRRSNRSDVKLSESKVKEIRELLSRNVKIKEISQLYGVSVYMIYLIRSGKRWK